MRRELLVLAIIAISAVGCFHRGSCPNSNPHIQMLRGSGVMLLRWPMKNFNSCGLEWSRFGTCCDFNSLKKAVASDVAQIKEDNSKLVTLLTTFQRYLPKLKEQAESLKKRATSDGNVANFANDIINFVSSGKSDQEIRESVDVCWREMATVRSASVCTACSGRSQVFFQNGRALMGEETCQRVVGKCFASFQIMAKTSELAHKYLALLDYIKGKGFGSRTLNKDIATGLERLKSVFCIPNSPYKSCSSTEGVAMDSQTTVWLCSNFVRLRETSIANEVIPLLQYLNTLLSNSREFLVFQKYTHGVRGFGSKKSPHLPHFNLDSNPFINNDLKVVKESDSLFQTFGSKGAFDETSASRPVNLTMSFP